MKHKTATFIGHSECRQLDADTVIATIETLIQDGYTTFLNGGMGGLG